VPNSQVIAGIELADEQLARRVAGGLLAVEALLDRELQSEFSFVTETASHLMHAGGKRFRPLFTIVAAGIGPNPEAPEVNTAAAVVELVHLATLYHDDVMDEAELRRGAKSANALWDNSIAILTGDFLFAHASRLVADLGPQAVRIIAETFAELVTGQTRETVGVPPGTSAIAHHLRVLQEKTASLIDTCGRFAGMFSGASADQIAALRRFGRSIGVAFQVADDIIDLVSTDSGKTPGTDLRAGVLTLPGLYAIEAGTDHRLIELVSRPLRDDAEVAEAIALLRESEGLAEARRTLDQFAVDATRALEELPPSPSRDALSSLTTFVVQRTN
jgi:heptaprenyl diphosphate synthase